MINVFHHYLSFIFILDILIKINLFLNIFIVDGMIILVDIYLWKLRLMSLTLFLLIEISTIIAIILDTMGLIILIIFNFLLR